MAVGLAWTPVGGDVLFVEASRMPGGSQLTLTGQLGDVMKESARIALSWFRANAARYGVDPTFYKDAEIHLHVPAGAIPKDGPSAGVTMVTALASALSGRPVRAESGDDRRDHALGPRAAGRAASRRRCWPRRRMGIREVILPRQNEKDIVEDLTPDQRQDLTVHYVTDMDEVLDAGARSRATRKRDAPQRHDEARPRFSLA